MKNNLEIQKTIIGDKIVLNIAGRIDANWSGFLDSALDKEVREGNYFIELNMKDVSYISSAGIGIFVKYYKLFKSVNGYLYISDVSENVRSVLNLVGLTQVFKTVETADSTNISSIKTNEKVEIIKDVKYFNQKLNTGKPLSCYLSGNPELIKLSGFTETNSRIEKLADDRYGVGIGAIGKSFNECENLFGEFAEFGNIVAHLPGDSDSKPDYAFKTGNYIPEIVSLYSVFFEGGFSHFIRFETMKDRLSVSLSELVETCINSNNITSAGMVILAETSGLIGASLNNSPLRSKQGPSLFKFPEVREQINFTTEPAYDKMLTLITGIAVKNNNDLLKPYTRPFSSICGIRCHFHAVVFPYRPLKKENIDLKETVRTLFESEQIISIMHLMSDDRETIGVGESEFIKGYCWIGNIDSIINNKEEKV